MRLTFDADVEAFRAEFVAFLDEQHHRRTDPWLVAELGANQDTTEP